VAFEFLPGRHAPAKTVVSLKKVHKGYGSKSIYEGLDFMIRRRERWCVMGITNGAGKSTPVEYWWRARPNLTMAR